jgi:hypothetical protein
MDTAAWASDWPRCLLLLELAGRYAESGRANGCAKLKGRLEDWRRRMEDAPPPIHSLLSELCYVCWLLGRGDLATARHHMAEAQRKAREIGGLLRQWRREEIRRDASYVRRRSRQLQLKARDLQERSELLIAQSAVLRRRPARAGAVPAQEALDSELVPA